MSDFKTQINTYLTCRGLKEPTKETSLKYCEKCNHVWEKIWSKFSDKSMIEKYTDMPTYGLKRKACNECG